MINRRSRIRPRRVPASASLLNPRCASAQDRCRALDKIKPYQLLALNTSFRNLLGRRGRVASSLTRSDPYAAPTLRADRAVGYLAPHNAAAGGNAQGRSLRASAFRVRTADDRGFAPCGQRVTARRARRLGGARRQHCAARGTPPSRPARRASGGAAMKISCLERDPWSRCSSE